MREFDLCVIGSGPAGQKAAIQAAKLGKRVCVVERESVPGGAAINTGTIPSKALREAILASTGRSPFMPHFGEGNSRPTVSLESLVDACREVIHAEIEMVRRHFARNGVTTFTGLGSFRDAHTVEIAGENSTEVISAKFIAIAVGTRPARPASIAFDEADIVTSDEMVTMKQIPASMIVVGGGVIGTEYASMFAALGVKVTIIEGRPRLLDFIDAEITEALQYHLRQSGVTLRLGEKVTTIKKVDVPLGARAVNNAMAEAVLESGKTLRADCLLYCVGRQGATAGLALEKAGLTADDRGRIKVNEHFQTEVAHIYACGDVIGFPALASTSMEQGRMAACSMFGEKCESYGKYVPYGIYSIPEISTVGWSEEQLTKEGVPYESGVAQYKEIARGQLIGDDIGMLKMLVHQESRVVLGIHAIGTGVTELIHIGQAAIAFNATVDYFVNVVFNYPTLAECYKVAALNVVNKLRNV